MSQKACFSVWSANTAELKPNAVCESGKGLCLSQSERQMIDGSDSILISKIVNKSQWQYA
jgi:hypothetical protein